VAEALVGLVAGTVRADPLGSPPPHPASATTEPIPATAATRTAYPRLLMRRRSAGSRGWPTARPIACPGW
jgi:hypothetical protein